MEATSDPTVSTRHCSRCKRCKPLGSFKSVHGQQWLYTNCTECRHQEKTKFVPPSKHPTPAPDAASTEPEAKLNHQQSRKRRRATDGVTAPQIFANLEECADAVREMVADAREAATGYDIAGAFRVSGPIAEADLSRTSREVLQKLSECDGHSFSAHHGLPTGFQHGKAVFILGCEQYHNFLTRVANGPRKSGKVDLTPAFDCRGSLSITVLPDGHVDFALRHAFPHDLEPSLLVSHATETAAATAVEATASAATRLKPPHQLQSRLKPPKAHSVRR
ncbi:hypothetical protein BV898_11675 [Hypsibius exemplaris]|uniref:Uncharacterized protein n=1 Tax=Hypsibius exemplaris TaxID=2072580 RepID=A0A1W0WFV0_HYPEX|nr:hypothetical protein BV898_11675 [Hypsibius exemplaris]